jgi:hypothetical protein
MSGGARLFRRQVPCARAGHHVDVAVRSRRAESWADRGMPGEDATPPRADPRESTLPWDMGILRQTEVSGPAGGGWDGGTVCGRDAAGGFRRGSTTSGTVGSRNALGKCDAGRRRNGNRGADLNRKRANDTPRRNASDENGGHRRPPSHSKANPSSRTRRVPRRRTPARGHAAGGIRRFFAIVPAVTSHCGIHLAPRRRIVATTAARPCVRPETANVSGCGARPKRGASNAAWNTGPHEPSAVQSMAHAGTWRRRGRRRRLVRSRGTLWVRSFSIGAMATGP